MPDDVKRDPKKLSLNPLTFDEALEGLLATEPPAKKRKQRQTSDTETAKPATKRAPKRKRAAKPRSDKTK